MTTRLRGAFGNPTTPTGAITDDGYGRFWREDDPGCSGAVPELGKDEASGELCAHTSWVDRSAFSGEAPAGPTGPNHSSEKNQTRQVTGRIESSMASAGRSLLDVAQRQTEAAGYFCLGGSKLEHGGDDSRR